VCLAAHPDDIEIAAGATLLGFAERGAIEGHWLTLTGSPERRAAGSMGILRIPSRAPFSQRTVARALNG
jgi:LmbE family N-acetylglucosaminyl deacetylase